MMAGVLVVTAMQCQVLHRRETRLMGPGFKQVRAGQRFVQPGRGVCTQSRKQDQIRAACHHVNGVDLQQLHALNAPAQAQTGGSPIGWLQQTLRSQMQVSRLRACQICHTWPALCTHVAEQAGS